MALRVKTFQIGDAASEEILNHFLEQKAVHHWSAAYNNESGQWSVFIAYETRDEQRNGRRTNENPRENLGGQTKRAMLTPRERKPELQEKSAHQEYTVHLDEKDMPLYEAMRKWRNARSKEHNVKPRAFFNNMVLETMVRERPQTADALREIVTEMDPQHFEQYKDELLAFLTSPEKGSGEVPTAAEQPVAETA